MSSLPRLTPSPKSLIPPSHPRLPDSVPETLTPREPLSILPPMRTGGAADAADSLAIAASCPGSPSPAPNPSASLRANPCHLPGYQIERVLGHGGMGTVFLARQISLDRLVALKVMSRNWAEDPVFVARFTREAFAAALLNHPNVVQIFDIGESGGTRYFSMEYVPGRTLAEVIRREGKLDPETAVGYIVQAARGLQHAHERGMIHRDVKPDNLLVTEQGVVKVADLGLVKTPDPTQPRPGRAVLDETDSGCGLASLPPGMTGHRIALGTPAYMAPEQCRDAAEVDHRADIYSLGCTLYALVTGRPPFEGESAVELMSHHAYTPLIPPEQIASRVPKELSTIIQRMMAKDADERFQSMAEVVCVLEHWLGVHHAGRFAPRDQDIERIERYARTFNTAPTALLRQRVVHWYLTACLIAAVLMMFFGRLDLTFGLAGMVLHSAGLYFILNGVTHRSYLFRRVNQFLIGLSLGDWLVGLAGVALFSILLWGLGLLWVWTGFGLIGAGLAIGLRYGLDRAIDQERYIPVAKCERLLQRLRLTGATEEELRQFVAKFSGADWEEFFEAVFGYEAKISTRTILLRAGNFGEREKFAAWREPILSIIDRIEKERRAQRERELLERVERARLLAAGVTEHSARAQAVAAANALVHRAERLRTADSRQTPLPPQDYRALVASGLSPALLTNAGLPLPSGRIESMTSGLRVILGIALILLCGLWAAQNLFRTAGNNSDGFSQVWRLQWSWDEPSLPLEIPGFSPQLTRWFDSWNVGIAGLLLILSRHCRNPGPTLLVLLGVAIVAFGHHLGIRSFDPIRSQQVGMILGIALVLVGMRFGR